MPVEKPVRLHLMERKYLDYGWIEELQAAALLRVLQDEGNRKPYLKGWEDAGKDLHMIMNRNWKRNF